MQHIPVLADECLRYLTEKHGSVFIDCTVGSGGHSELLCKTIGKSIKLLGIDLDQSALDKVRQRLASWPGVTLAHSDFSNVTRLADDAGFNDVDGIIADLGQSTVQLDNPDRGFSYRFRGPLDMRFDTSGGITAAEWINQVSINELDNSLRDLGQERRHRRIAQAIMKHRPIHHTNELEQIIRKVCPTQFIEKTLARVFMVLRMVVNNEVEALNRMLPQALSLLKPGGRLVVISFDSNQDRPVKQFFKLSAQDCICPPELPICVCSKQAQAMILTRRVIRPSDEEISHNPRARSAKLRAVEKL